MKCSLCISEQLPKCIYSYSLWLVAPGCLIFKNTNTHQKQIDLSTQLACFLCVLVLNRESNCYLFSSLSLCIFNAFQSSDLFSIKSFRSGRKRKPCKSVRRRTLRSRTLGMALERRFFGKAPKRSLKQRPSRVSQVPARLTVSAHPVRTRRLRAWLPRSAPGTVDSAVASVSENPREAHKSLGGL